MQLVQVKRFALQAAQALLHGTHNTPTGEVQHGLAGLKIATDFAGNHDLIRASHVSENAT